MKKVTDEFAMSLMKEIRSDDRTDNGIFWKPFHRIKILKDISSHEELERKLNQFLGDLDVLLNAEEIRCLSIDSIDVHRDPTGIDSFYYWAMVRYHGELRPEE